MISVNVSFDFVTRKKLTDDMLLSMSEQLEYVSASFSVDRRRKRVSVVMTVEDHFLQYADMDARDALEHELAKYKVKPKYTRIVVEQAA